MPSKKHKKKEEVKENPENPEISPVENEESIEETQETEDPKTKKVIYIDIDDEVTAVFDKVHKTPADNIFIVVPKRAAIFQSIVNLKILKRKAGEEKKKISFITNDTNGIYLANQLGIDVFDKTKHGDNPSLVVTDLADDSLRITPLKASINSIEDDAPTRITEKKVSISEILRKNRGKKTLNISAIDSGKQKVRKERPKLVLVAPNRHALTGLLVLTVFILMVIVYIALPGVTVFITPSAGVLEKSVNITLADFQKNKVQLETLQTHMIASYPLSTTINKTITYTATGKKFSDYGSNSQGKITIYNTTRNGWDLVPKTRFQNADGLIFRINDYVKVPAANTEGPGKAEAFVIADPVDANGVVIGERGNIGPSKFFLPGLQENSRSKIYAESAEPFSGGVTDFNSFITAEDIEAAKKQLTDSLINSAISELKGLVDEQSKLAGNGTVYTLLEGDGAIKTGEPQISLPKDLENKEVTEFSITGEINVSGVYYNHEEMIAILRDELELKKSPQKELVRINEDSTSYRIFEWDEAAGKVKLTANIKGIEQYEIDTDKENGKRLLQKIRDHIAGKEVEIAKQYIQNLPEVNKVEIKSWPAWAPTVPKLPDNIEFEIRDAISVD